MSFLGNLARYCVELRFTVNQTALSAGTVSYIKSCYPAIKAMNPSFPLLIREADLAEPKISLRQKDGKERSVSTAGMNQQQVADALESLIKQ